MRLGYRSGSNDYIMWDKDYDKVSGLLEYRRPLIWTNGVFDIIHTGHLRLLKFCRDHSKDGRVIVGINSDSSAKSLNKSHPLINNEIDRAMMLASLKDVDFVVIFDEPNPAKCLELIKPNYFIKGGDYTIDELPENEKAIVEEYGGKVLVSGKVEGKSTSSIYKKIYDIGYNDARDLDDTYGGGFI